MLGAELHERRASGLSAYHLWRSQSRAHLEKVSPAHIFPFFPSLFGETRFYLDYCESRFPHGNHLIDILGRHKLGPMTLT
jgi:hypothetical protein